MWYNVAGLHPAVAFVETPTFTRRITALGLEDSLRELQYALLKNPTAGVVDPGTGGLRKVRIADPGRGKGKRGGGRVHYLWLPDVSIVYLIYVYAKDELATLAPQQKSQLAAVAHAIKDEWGGK